MEEHCIFCEIRDGNITSEVLYRDTYCFVICDISPRAPVHLLVIPNQHFTSSDEANHEYRDVIGAMYMAAHKMARVEGVEDSGYRLVINQGLDAGQEVTHLHMHLLGGKRLGAMN